MSHDKPRNVVGPWDKPKLRLVKPVEVEVADVAASKAMKERAEWVFGALLTPFDDIPDAGDGDKDVAIIAEALQTERELVLDEVADHIARGLFEPSFIIERIRCGRPVVDD